MSSKWPMRLGSPLKNQTWLTGVASAMWPSRSRRTLAWVTSTPHLSQITPRCFMRLYLWDEHIDRLGQARGERRVALDDRLVNLRAAGDIVGLGREKLLKDVRRAVRFERPDLHFPEPLTAKLRLAPERLLGDQRVR